MHIITIYAYNNKEIPIVILEKYISTFSNLKLIYNKEAELTVEAFFYFMGERES